MLNLIPLSWMARIIWNLEFYIGALAGNCFGIERPQSA